EGSLCSPEHLAAPPTRGAGRGRTAPLSALPWSLSPFLFVDVSGSNPFPRSPVGLTRAESGSTQGDSWPTIGRPERRRRSTLDSRVGPRLRSRSTQRAPSPKVRGSLR